MCNNKAGKVLRRLEGTLNTYSERAGIGFKAACGRLDILAAKGLFDVADGQIARGQRTSVDPYAECIFARSAHLYTRNTIQRGKAVHQIAVGIVRQFRRRHVVTGKVQPDDDIVVRVSFLDLRWVRLWRQLVEHAGHTVTYVIGSRVNVLVNAELNTDARPPVNGVGVDEPDARNTGNTVLDHTRNAGFDHVCRSTGITRIDRDDRGIDIRILAQRKAIISNQPENDQDQGDDRCKYRALDGDIRNQHPGY